MVKLRERILILFIRKQFFLLVKRQGADLIVETSVENKRERTPLIISKPQTNRFSGQQLCKK